MKKVLSIVLALVMMLSLTAVAFADDVIDTESELQAALNAGGNVKLGGNVTVVNGLVVPAGVTVTLDLAGFTISQTKAQTGAYQMLLNEGNLTINDSVGGGKISYTDSGNGGSYISDTIYNCGVIVVNGGTIENLSSATVAYNGYPHALDTYSGTRDTSVTINGGTIYCAEYSAIRMFCVSTTNKADLVINEGATIQGAVDMQNGIPAAALGSLTINGGDFETTANVNNIRFANWGHGSGANYGIEAEIKGGTFDGELSDASVPAGAAGTWDSEIVSGGTFTKEEFAEKLIEEYQKNDSSIVVGNEVIKKDENGTVSSGGCAHTNWQWASTSSYHIKGCSDCHACFGEELAHTYDEWYVVTAPTTVTYGKCERACTECGFVQSKRLSPVDGEDAGRPVIPESEREENGEKANPGTGAIVAMDPAVVLGAVSATAAAVFALKK